MKNHIPTFDQFVNESISGEDKLTTFDEIFESGRVKDFGKVKVGDKAEDYHGEEWKVVAKGTGKDFDKTLSKYDESGAMIDMQIKPAQFGLSKKDWDELEMIAVQKGRETAVFTYDPDGACVYESINEGTKDEFVSATLVKDDGDLRKGSTVKVEALDYTKKGDKEKVSIIRPDGKKSEILKGNLSVKI
jgi:hypothetical protein